MGVGAPGRGRAAQLEDLPRDRGRRVRGPDVVQRPSDRPQPQVRIRGAEEAVTHLGAVAGVVPVGPLQGLVVANPNLANFQRLTEPDMLLPIFVMGSLPTIYQSLES